ncbi:Kazal domain [Trinorchestia longiramus]|nr:Kazal domain [Trinorchestia longiramus]
MVPSVCASDGHSYSSECEVKERACLLQQDIVVVAFGHCQDVWTEPPVRRSTLEEDWGVTSALGGESRMPDHPHVATRRHSPASGPYHTPPAGGNRHGPALSVTPSSQVPAVGRTVEHAFIIPSFLPHSFLEVYCVPVCAVTQFLYEQALYAQAPYAQAPYAQAPYAQAPYAQAPYAQAPYAQAPYAQAPYAQAPYAQISYSSTRVLQHSSTPALEYSSTRVLQHSSTPALEYSSTRVLQHSSTPVRRYSVSRFDQEG